MFYVMNANIFVRIQRVIFGEDAYDTQTLNQISPSLTRVESQNLAKAQ